MTSTQVGVFTLGVSTDLHFSAGCAWTERRVHIALWIFRALNRFEFGVQAMCSELPAQTALQKWRSHLVRPPTHDYNAAEYAFSCKKCGIEASIERCLKGHMVKSELLT